MRIKSKEVCTKRICQVVWTSEEEVRGRGVWIDVVNKGLICEGVEGGVGHGFGC